jgi:hypothetical protein
MKLTKFLREQADGTATILLLFDKLQKTPAFNTAINELKMPVDKYNAIMKFASLLGIPDSKFESFMSNMKNIKSDDDK